jgi:hypothetical protein
MTKRFTNVTSKVTVSVSEETAERLGSEWVDADAVARSDTPDTSWKVAELKEYAAENGIELGDATRKDDILAAITIDGSAEGDESADDKS